MIPTRSPAVAANVWDDGDARALALTAAAVHAHGALAGLELYHGGASSLNGESRAVRIAPSQQASTVQFGSLAREMTAADIARVQQDWVAAARRGRDAGFDIIYVYGAHGYLMTQFMSPATNRRTDGYGGGLAGRGRFWLETLAAVRAAVGDDCAIATRIAVHGAAGLPGIEAEEMLALIAMADHAGRPVGRQRRLLAGGLRDLPVLSRGQPAAVDAPRPRGHGQAGRRRRPLLQPGPDGRHRPVRRR